MESHQNDDFVKYTFMMYGIIHIAFIFSLLFACMFENEFLTDDNKLELELEQRIVTRLTADFREIIDEIVKGRIDSIGKDVNYLIAIQNYGNRMKFDITKIIDNIHTCHMFDERYILAKLKEMDNKRYKSVKPEYVKNVLAKMISFKWGTYTLEK